MDNTVLNVGLLCELPVRGVLTVTQHPSSSSPVVLPELVRCQAQAVMQFSRRLLETSVSQMSNL